MDVCEGLSVFAKQTGLYWYDPGLEILELHRGLIVLIVLFTCC